MVRRIVKCSLLALAALFLTAQFVQPPHGRESATKRRTIWEDPNVTPEVKTILRRSCADCHSDQTRWPWYARVAPASWIIANDVHMGREKLDLSDWPLRPQSLAEEIVDAVASREMPPRKYLFLHPDARLSSKDLAALDDWIDDQEKSTAANLKP